MKSKSKEKIYLTSITLHIKSFRKTINFSKVAQKGRMYCAIDNLGKNSGGKKIEQKDNSILFGLDIPNDIQERLNNGEVELIIPEEGLPIYAGRDVDEFLQSKNGKRLMRGFAKNKKK